MRALDIHATLCSWITMVGLLRFSVHSETNLHVFIYPHHTCLYDHNLAINVQ